VIESYCRTHIWYKCRSITGEPPVVHLKGQPIPHWEYDGFFDGSDAYAIMWSFDTKRARNKTFRQAVGFFSRNGAELCQVWITDRFNGDWRKAILQYGTFNNFFNAFEAYFNERKEKFMAKTKELIQQMYPELKNIKNIRPNSHGGVANLLRVLTRTMNEQGSSIRTIAKVQYSVCLQAGIYVPEEFINDVLTAADMDPNIWKEDDSK